MALWARRSFRRPAIDCGRTSLVVIDPDVKDGKKGLDAWNALVAMHGPLAAPVVLTPSSELHVYLRRPARFPCYPLRQRSHAPAHRCQRCRWLHHSPWSPHRDLHWRVEDIRALIEKGAA